MVAKWVITSFDIYQTKCMATKVFFAALGVHEHPVHPLAMPMRWC